MLIGSSIEIKLILNYLRDKELKAVLSCYGDIKLNLAGDTKILHNIRFEVMNTSSGIHLEGRERLTSDETLTDDMIIDSIMNWQDLDIESKDYNISKINYIDFFEDVVRFYKTKWGVPAVNILVKSFNCYKSFIIWEDTAIKIFTVNGFKTKAFRYNIDKMKERYKPTDKFYSIIPFTGYQSFNEYKEVMGDKVEIVEREVK